MTTTQYESSFETVTATIASGASISSIVDGRGLQLVGIQRNDSSLGNASYPLLGSVDGTNFYRISSTGGTDVALTVGSSQAIFYIVPEAGRAARYWRLDPSSNESADKTFTFIFKSGN